MIKVHINTDAMHGMNAMRGVGVYTQKLKEYLQHMTDVNLVDLDGDITHYPFFDLFFHTLPFKKKTKTVVTIHDVIPLVFPDKYKPGIKGTVRYYQQRMSLMTVDAVITDSLCSKKDIVSYLHYPEEKVHVIYLSSDPLMEKQTKSHIEEMRKKYTLPQKYVLYIGDINYNKNLPAFISACSKLQKDIHVVMVGTSLLNTEIPEGKALHDRIALEKMEERMHLLTTVPRSPATDLAAIISGAVCYVQPSLYEGFGLPVLDAMRCETPVACSKTSSLTEVGGDAVVYFNPEDVGDMAIGIEKACSLDAKEKHMLIQKMKEQEKKFSWDKAAKETYEVYKKVLYTS